MKKSEKRRLAAREAASAPVCPESCGDEGAVMEVAMKAGRLLLENGAEIFRVEETMERMCRYYRVENPSFFVLSNGIFMTGSGHTPQTPAPFAHVEHIPVKGAQLDRVVAVNQLSREIERGGCTLEEASARLDAIARMPGKKRWQQILASGAGSACFCILFGGGLTDALASLIAGLLLYAYVLYLSAPPHVPHHRKRAGRHAGERSLRAVPRPRPGQQPEPHDYRRDHAPDSRHSLHQRRARPGGR